MEKTTNKKILETIKLLKKDNAQNCKKAKKEGIMVNWNVDKVKSVVDVYLDNVLRLLQIKEVRNSSQA